MKKLLCLLMLLLPTLLFADPRWLNRFEYDKYIYAFPTVGDVTVESVAVCYNEKDALTAAKIKVLDKRYALLAYTNDVHYHDEWLVANVFSRSGKPKRCTFITHYYSDSATVEYYVIPKW